MQTQRVQNMADSRVGKWMAGRRRTRFIDDVFDDDGVRTNLLLIATGE